jgi:putative membrane protein
VEASAAADSAAVAADSAAAERLAVGELLGANMFLTEEEAKQIEAKVAEVELGTAGELVVAVARRSDDYAAVRAPWAGAFTLMVAVLLYELFPWTDPLWLLLGQLPVAVAGYALSGSGRVLRWICPAQALAAQVEARAAQIFVERGVANTRDRSGVLIYVSESERRVRLLADQGINERVAETEWQDDVALIVAGIGSGHAKDGLVTAIDRIGQLLAETFPPRPDDVNELPNSIVQVD